eukprot:TRINITY_DN90_c0_g1_i3.p1 TRINITY_DN90_c0_g1~~TRINITY_DN90_c0_g1_i3.p1  ORF type:complete len:119 (+),score=19.14 TRINITY_DN90_c0_g1_i3:77-433(+)
MKFITVFLLAILAFALITEAKTAKHVSKKLKKAPVLMDDDTLSCDCCSEVLNRFKASNLDQINSGFCYSSYDVNDDCFTPASSSPRSIAKTLTPPSCTISPRLLLRADYQVLPRISWL